MCEEHSLSHTAELVRAISAACRLPCVYCFAKTLCHIMRQKHLTFAHLHNQSTMVEKLSSVLCFAALHFKICLSCHRRQREKKLGELERPLPRGWLSLGLIAESGQLYCSRSVHKGFRTSGHGSCSGLEGTALRLASQF